MGDGRLAVDQVRVVLRVVLRDLDVVAREGADDVQVVPPAQRHQLRAPVAEVAGEQLGTPVAGRRAVAGHPRALDDVDVLVDQLRADPAPPHARDHRVAFMERSLPDCHRGVRSARRDWVTHGGLLTTLVGYFHVRA